MRSVWFLISLVPLSKTSCVGFCVPSTIFVACISSMTEKFASAMETVKFCT